MRGLRPGDPPPRRLVLDLANLGRARFRLGRYDGAYAVLAQAADGVRARYGDRRFTGDAENARAALVRDLAVFQGQIAAGWFLAHP
jgi:hypothetical protein